MTAIKSVAEPTDGCDAYPPNHLTAAPQAQGQGARGEQ